MHVFAPPVRNANRDLHHEKHRRIVRALRAALRNTRTSNSVMNVIKHIANLLQLPRSTRGTLPAACAFDARSYDRPEAGSLTID
ncbi:MAG: hypothetical protein KDI78_03890 [Xanthomonadales bacterium]|nr:hypothetical protein [Xanthomonadales bacterium]